MQIASAVADANGSLLVILRGDVDFTNASQVMAIAAAAGGISGSDVTIDLADVTFLDSSGIAVLVRLLYLAQERGGLLTLVDPAPKVQDQLHLAGLSQLLGPTAGPPDWLKGVSREGGWVT